MITPFFAINQDEEFIYINIKVSHIRFNAQNIEMIVENELFIFSLQPYYLRIRLPFPLVDDERSHAAFDSSSDNIKVKVPKLTKGQYFPDLDLTAKLLSRSNEASAGQNESFLTEVGSSGLDVACSANIGRSDSKAVGTKPLIQELDVDSNVMDSIDNNKSQLQQIVHEGEEFNWEISQTVPLTEKEEDSIRLTAIKYGFNDEYDKIIEVSISNGNDINELGNPEATAAVDRVIERLIKENIKFDPEYYAADYIMEKYPSEDDDKMFKELIGWKSPHTTKYLRWQKKQNELPQNERSKIMPVEFSEKEQELMMGLPKKSYLVEESKKHHILLTIISLLFSYNFDMRENEGDHNIESAWTIGRLTPQFSFLDSQIIASNTNTSILKANIITSIRRALSYPLHRNYNMVSKVWDDVYYNLRGGKRAVLKSLLDLRELFRYHDVYYVYKTIWLDDLLAYLISDNVTENIIRGLAHDLRKEVTTITKKDITFEKLEDPSDEEMNCMNLEDIEVAAERMYQNFQNENV